MMFLASALLHHSISTAWQSVIVAPVATSSLSYNLCCLHMQNVAMCTLCSVGDKLANYSDLTPRTSQYPPNQAKWHLLALMRFLWTKSNSVFLPQCRHQDLSTCVSGYI